MGKRLTRNCVREYVRPVDENYRKLLSRARSSVDEVV